MSENNVKVNPVRVFLRERPFLRSEFASPKKEISTKCGINSSISNKKMIVIDDKTFLFDHVFYAKSTQEEVYQITSKPVLQKCLQGYNGVILAYGQSGSGKTFSCGLGVDPAENPEKAGIVWRVLDDLFSMINDPDESFECKVSVSFIEIYNDKVYDLLLDDSTESIFQKGSRYNGSSKKSITSRNDAITIITEANKNRHVRSTTLNSSSSRSHAIFTINLQIQTTDKNFSSDLNLVDLAGSEGLKRTGHQGIALQEGVAINQGLLTIGKVLQALSTGSKVPYRDSVLSSVLQDSLNSNSYLSLLACISPSKFDKSETMSTIRFAQSAKNIKIDPKMNLVGVENKKAPWKTPGKSFLVPTVRSNKMSSSTPYNVPRKTISGSTLPKQPLTSSQRQNVTNSYNPGRANSTMIVNRAQSTNNLAAGNGTKQPLSKQSLAFSDFSLNLSSSTTIDHPIQSAEPNYSPLRRIIESQIQKGLNQFFSSFQVNSTLNVPNLQNTTFQVQVDAADDQTLEDFTVKIPDFPVNEADTVSNDLKRTRLEARLDSNNDVEFAVPMVPPMPKNSRVSRRLNSHDVSIPSVPARRSERLARRSISVPPPEDRKVRRSTRLMSVDTEDIPNVKIEEPTVRVKRETRPKIKNKVVASYFDSPASSSNQQVKKVTKKTHKSAILDMLNTASMKQLQMLPCVGLKTAYSIVTHRTLNGKFKKIEDLSKVPIMKGKILEKFLEANNLKG